MIFIYSYFTRISFLKIRMGIGIGHMPFSNLTRWVCDFSLLFYYIIRFLNMEPSWHSWMNPNYLSPILFMYYWILFVNILFRIFLITGLQFSFVELSLTSFGNCDGFPSFIRLYDSLIISWRSERILLLNHLDDPDVWEEERESLITLLISCYIFLFFFWGHFGNLWFPRKSPIDSGFKINLYIVLQRISSLFYVCLSLTLLSCSCVSSSIPLLAFSSLFPSPFCHIDIGSQ